MRIALFSETFPPHRNGISIVLDRLVRSLCRDGHEVLVATASEGPYSNGVPLPAGCTVVRPPSIPFPPSQDVGRIALPFSPGVARAVRRFKPDVIHVATAYSLGLIGLRVAKSLGIPVVSSFHACIPDLLGYYGIPWGSEALWRYLKWFHTDVAFTFCPSEATAALLRDRGFKNVGVWAHGVETDRFSPAYRCPATRARLGADTVHLLYVGRLAPEKDLPVLFDAYRRVCATNSSQGVHLTVAGDGTYMSRARAQASRDVSFVGYLEGDALPTIYASADVFVFPSRAETQGNVVLEAMASGLPVIGMAAGGVPDNVHHGVNGLLCVPGDPQSFAQGILKLVHHPQLRAELGGNARTWAEGHTWDLTLGPLVAGYEEAMDG